MLTLLFGGSSLSYLLPHFSQPQFLPFSSAMSQLILDLRLTDLSVHHLLFTLLMAVLIWSMEVAFKALMEWNQSMEQERVVIERSQKKRVRS